jgi:hypothetical protein
MSESPAEDENDPSEQFEQRLAPDADSIVKMQASGQNHGAYLKLIANETNGDILNSESEEHISSSS